VGHRAAAPDPPPAAAHITERRGRAWDHRPVRRSALASLWEHPWLVGDPSLPGRVVGRRVHWLAITSVVGANIASVVSVLCFALFALPKPDEDITHATTVVNVLVAVGYVLVAGIVGMIWGHHAIEGGPNGTQAWLDEDREPTRAQQQRLLRAPLRIALVQAVLWGIGVVVFVAINLVWSGLLALGVGVTVALGGLSTCAEAYLLTELALRPVTARALAPGVPTDRVLPGVASRLVLAWALGSGVILLGIGLVAIVALTPIEIDEQSLAVTMLALSALGLVAGAGLVTTAAYLTAHPIGAIRRGIERVRQGDYDAQLPVWDTTEVGLLQAGFNEMAEGLGEREHIRDLFGRHVGEEVARHALDGGVRLGGELRDVAVLFVDIVGSTGLAERRPPTEVVELLNRFFAVVVDVVEARGGWVNKFEGDAALAIFGAPVEIEDPYGRALQAARDLDTALRDRVGELQAGIGVAAGQAVAGHIGAERRFEYTVIGDPVNEAARLTELAKRQQPRVLASQATLTGALDGEGDHWRLGETVTLRGRRQQTRLACPVGDDPVDA
jgi:adenylate cyclase